MKCIYASHGPGDPEIAAPCDTAARRLAASKRFPQIRTPGSINPLRVRHPAPSHRFGGIARLKSDAKHRLFSTTLGHNNETVSDKRYLDLVTRSLPWSCNKLDRDGKPLAGYGPAAAVAE